MAFTFGDHWRARLADALERCQCLILFVTPDSVASKEVKNEVARALDVGKQVLPIFLTPTRLKGELAFDLSRIQHIVPQLVNQAAQSITQTRQTGSRPCAVRLRP